MTIQPVLFVLMFRYVFGGSIHVPGVSYTNYLMAGIFVTIVLFGAQNTAIGMAEDLHSGLIERFRSLVMARSADRAAFGPFGSEHEVVDKELGSAGEQISQRPLGAGRIEDVLLVDLHPRQRPPLPGEFVAAPAVFLLSGEQRQARLKMFLVSPNLGAVMSLPPRWPSLMQTPPGHVFGRSSRLVFGLRI